MAGIQGCARKGVENIMGVGWKFKFDPSASVTVRCRRALDPSPPAPTSMTVVPHSASRVSIALSFLACSLAMLCILGSQHARLSGRVSLARLDDAQSSDPSVFDEKMQLQADMDGRGGPEGPEGKSE
eukprot:763987-Hanusia_phi.AAC.3